MKFVKYAGYLLLGCLILLVGMYLWMVVLDYLHRRDVAAENSFRCHVFTEMIKPGMTQEDIITVLDQYGPYDMNRPDFSEGKYQLYISFTDANTRKMFGGSYIVLEFSNYLYTGAWLPYGIGEFLPVCEPE